MLLLSHLAAGLAPWKVSFVMQYMLTRTQLLAMLSSLLATVTLLGNQLSAGQMIIQPVNALVQQLIHFNDARKAETCMPSTRRVYHGPLSELLH